MNARDAYARLRRAGVPLVKTADAAALLGQTVFAASKTLARLAAAGLVTQVWHGAYWIDGDVDPYRVAAWVTAPFDAYVSLQSALYLRGAIEQIPEIIYVVTLGRSRTVRTRVAVFSVHHIVPVLFGGFETTREGVKLARVEKALFDLAYLAGGRSRLFTKVPELELPRGFKRGELQRWVDRAPSPKAKTQVTKRLRALL